MNICVVDDESHVLELLENYFSRPLLNDHRMFKARSGLQAVKLLKEQKIELLITDLKMPEMNGIDLISRVKAEYPSLQIIALSAFGDFPLVKSAYECGICNYIMKAELDFNKLKEAVSNVEELLLQQRVEEIREKKYRNDLDHMKEIISDNIIYIKQGLLKELLFSNYNPDEKLIQRMKEMEIKYNPGACSICIVVVREFNNIKKQFNLYENEMVKLFLKQIYEILQRKETGDAVYLGDGKFALLFFWGEDKWGKSLAETRLILTDIHNDLSLFIMDYYSSEIFAGCGYSPELNGPVSNVYREAEIALLNYYMGKKGLIISRGSLNRLGDNNPIELDKIYDSIKILVRSADFSESVSKINVIIAEFKKITPLQIPGVKGFFIDMYKYLSVLIRNDPDLDVQRLKERLKLYEELEERFSPLDEFVIWLKEILIKIMEIKSGKSSIVRKAIKIIKENLDKNISRADIASLIEVSESYLSRQFKKEMGYGLKQFILNMKMEEAIILLRAGKFKIYQIAEMVGFNSTEHFSRMFKRVTGYNPIDYR
jgi:two-component system, response regulator YesN